MSQSCFDAERSCLAVMHGVFSSSSVSRQLSARIVPRRIAHEEQGIDDETYQSLLLSTDSEDDGHEDKFSQLNPSMFETKSDGAR